MTELNEAEQRRLDQLLGMARALHTGALAVAGVSVVLAASEGKGQLTVPLGNVTITYHSAVILTYVLCILLASMSMVFLRMASPFIGLDPRRPPFAWAPLAIRPLSRFLMLVWIAVPVMVSCFATSAASALQAAGTPKWVVLPPLTLVLLAGFVFDLPMSFGLYLEMLRERRDGEGRPLTLSIYLHFMMRMIRGGGISIAALIFIVSLVPSLEHITLPWAAIPLVLSISVWLLCNLAIPFRKGIDRYGSRHGFAEWYEPSDGPRDAPERAGRAKLPFAIRIAMSVFCAISLIAVWIVVAKWWGDAVNKPKSQAPVDSSSIDARYRRQITPGTPRDRARARGVSGARGANPQPEHP